MCPQFAYNLNTKAIFIELPAFSRYRADYLDDESFRDLQKFMMQHPEAGNVTEGTDGLRKLRHTDQRRCKAMKKRNLFAEITEGFDALADARVGKQTLRTHKVESYSAPIVSAAELRALRERLHSSRPVFANYLRTTPRTLENWEQGRAKPNAQAALLIRLVQKFPDTVERLALF